MLTILQSFQENHHRIVQRQLNVKQRIPSERYISPGQRQKINDDRIIINLLENTLTINLLNNKPNQPPNFRTKNLVELNDDVSVWWRLERIATIVNLNLKLRCPRLCANNYAYIVVKRTITVRNTEPAGAAGIPNNKNRKLLLKKCSSFFDFIS